MCIRSCTADTSVEPHARQNFKPRATRDAAEVTCMGFKRIISADSPQQTKDLIVAFDTHKFRKEYEAYVKAHASYVPPA